MVKKIIIIINFFAFSLFMNSQEVSVDLAASKQEVAVNEDFRISLIITSDTDDINIDEYPQLDQCVAIKQYGQSRNINMMASNQGIQKTISINFEYICKISKEGKYDIGPFVIRVKNKKFQSNITSINVSANNVGNNVSNNIKEKNYESDKSNYYIIKTEQTKKEIFENEFVDIEVNLYCYRNYDFRIRNIKKLNYPSNAWIENLLNKNNILSEKVIINNYAYAKHTIEKDRIYISKSGEYEIEPFEINFDGITSNDFFAIQDTIDLKTKPVVINVKPLPPKENEHRNFDGAVGNFNISYSLNPQKINPSEASTLFISLEGEGNFHNIDKINFGVDENIDIYSTKSETKTADNRTKIKTWEIILVPSKPGKYNVSIEDFSYFDANEKKYKTIKGNSIKLTVAGKIIENNKNIKDNSSINTDLENKNLINNENENKIIKDNIVNQEINFLKLNIGSKNELKKIDLLFRFQIILYMMLAAILILFILLKYYNYSFVKNGRFVVQKKAYKNFFTKINNLNKDIPKIGILKGIDSLSNTIETYFIHKFNIKSIEFTRKDIENKLKDYLTSEQVKTLNDYIKQLNIIRFGGNKITTEEFDRITGELKNFIKNIDTNNINNNHKSDKVN
ncbi:MAG: BatD family protein [Spirochaetes bacterium]|nr:BatD family protein [Spirochaetota bacterium]